MEEHPIQGLMNSAMESIKEMVEVNTVIGDPVETPDGTVIIPVTRVSCGFAAGGSEFSCCNSNEGGQGSQGGTEQDGSFPFGGGSGAGVSVKPVGFLVVSKGQVRLLPIDSNVALDRLLDMAPEVLDKIQNTLSNKQQKNSN